MKDNITYVGLDVHKNSLDVAFADSEKTGEVRHYGKPLHNSEHQFAPAADNFL